MLRHQSREVLAAGRSFFACSRIAFAVSSLSMTARRSSHRGRCFAARATVYSDGLSSEHDYGHDGDGRSDGDDDN